MTRKLKVCFDRTVSQGFINFWPLLSKLGGIHMPVYVYIYISTNRSTTWRTVVFQCFRQQRYISTSTCALFCLSGEGQAILRSSTLQTLETSTLGELATWHMKGWVEHLGCSYGSPKRMLNLKPFPTNHPFVPGIMKGNPSSLGIRASKSKDVAV